ncbi:ATP-binding protein [Candidatus Pacearchaeota archaeon]|nr:ATP-binding protein [Candidatus Pacearchaeota archaeon]
MDLKPIIIEQRQEIEKIDREENLIARDKLKDAKKYLLYPNILVITGIRRCGKSIFSYLLERDSKFAYINFDDERLIGLKGNELNKILEAFYELYGEIDYIILDEIQNISGWELFVNRLRRTKRVILTGSNSNLLSGELATHLTGRYIDIKLFPFSFKEYLLFNQFKFARAYSTEEKSSIINYMKNYLISGGLPESYKFGRAIVMKIYEDILNKDILLRHHIKKLEELKGLSKYLITNSSEEITYSKLSKILNIKHISTISNWISYLEESFIIFKLERFNFKFKQQFIAPKKIYCIDTGIVEVIGFKFSENKGKVMENCIAIELQRKKWVNPNFEVYYWKNHQQEEVDFVIKGGNKILELIQSSYVNSREEIKERELKGLIKASKDLKCNSLTIITWDYEGEILFEDKKIKIIPLWKWMLDSNN